MFVFRLTRKNLKKILIGMAIAALLAGVICTIAALHAVDKPRDTTDSGISLVVENGNADFFRQLGIAADEENAVTKSIVIPSEFNQTYTEYNALQQQAGLDLTPYQGQKAEQITVPVQSEQAKFAVLLVRKERVIGGHLTNGEYGGELLPLPLSGQNNGKTG